MPARRGEKWEGRLKIGGQVVGTRRFETRRAAVEWERRQRGAFEEHGYDPRIGKVGVEVLLADWLEHRTGRVSHTTLNTDRFLLPTHGQKAGRTDTEAILPIWFRKLHVGKITPAAITAWQDGLLARGLAPTSVKRHRESLSSFFTWCVAEGYVATNPVKGAPPPRDRRAREAMRPLPAHEFEVVVANVAAVSETYADLVRVLGRTGIRWGEARAMLVRDFTEVPVPALQVVRNQPEGTPEAKAPKSGRGRRVPVPDVLVSALRRFAAGKRPTDLLLTRPGGGQLHRSTFVKQTGWAEAGHGRTLHDLRHTAACEWIVRGVPLTTVQAWLGHGSIEVTARYLHHLGDSADRAALQLLNNGGAAQALPTGAATTPGWR